MAKKGHIMAKKKQRMVKCGKEWLSIEANNGEVEAKNG
jgi:hypothetical protein